MAWKLKDDKFKNQKCYNCLFNNFGTFDEFTYDCLKCVDRPTRYKDKSQFIEDLTDEEKEQISQESEDRVNRTGKFGY